jgi:hypothetical protein
MISTNIREKLAKEPFEPFRIRLSSGDPYIIRHPDLVVILKSEVFVAHPNSDRHTFIPLLHIAAVETLNGRNGNGRAGRRGGRPR